MSEPLEEAVRVYLARQDRTQHPDGEFDKGMRWHPSRAEVRDCCNTIRPPSRMHPYSLLLHCRTMQHIAWLYAVDLTLLRRAVRVAKLHRRQIALRQATDIVEAMPMD